jgi:hypothetical protein
MMSDIYSVAARGCCPAMKDDAAPSFLVLHFSTRVERYLTGVASESGIPTTDMLERMDIFILQEGQEMW